MRSTIQNCRQPRLLAGLFLCIAFLLAANPAGACGLDWSKVTWPNLGTVPVLGPWEFEFDMTDFEGAPCPPGLKVTITVTREHLPGDLTSGFFNPPPSEDCVASVDPNCGFNEFGASHDLGVFFDPSTSGTSPIIIKAEFSSPVPNLKFQITDIDFSGFSSNPSFGARLDKVKITSDVGNPILSDTPAGGTPTYTIDGNEATAKCTVNPFPFCNPTTDTTSATVGPAPPDAGTVLVDFSARPAVREVIITYSEAGTGTNPTARGIGVLAKLTPVELLEFSIE